MPPLRGLFVILGDNLFLPFENSGGRLFCSSCSLREPPCLFVTGGSKMLHTAVFVSFEPAKLATDRTPIMGLNMFLD